MPTTPLRSSRSMAAHSSTLAAMANALARRRSLAPWIAAVISDRLAVAIGDAGPIRHLVGTDHVAQTHLGGLELELSGNDIDDALHRERRLRTAGAAIGRVGHLIGSSDARLDRERIDL